LTGELLPLLEGMWEEQGVIERLLLMAVKMKRK
jgi:hypothetical protein